VRTGEGCALRGEAPSKAESVGEHPFVNFYVLGPRVEPEAGERSQSVGEWLLPSARQDEVDVRDSDVVRPDVNLFHAEGATREHMS